MTSDASCKSLRSWLQQHQELLEDYLTFLRFPTVSAESSHKSALLSCVDWLRHYIAQMGLEVELWPTQGHPVLFASYDKAGPSKPTLLIYNHYDVQPVDPLSEWHSPPFEPMVRHGCVYARGAEDNKGQCFFVLQAIRALMERDGSLPLNLKLCVEGEEEVGSPSLATLLRDKQEALKADYLAIVDVGIPAADRPAITLGLRGIVTMTVTVEGTLTDLHSGTHGGLVFNPLHALVSLLASLRDAAGRITVPGFYDDVEELTLQEKSLLTLDFDSQSYERLVGASPTGGEHAYSPCERAWLRPTLEINGLSGGYQGSGFKTVIPAKATAKLSCRLVPHQDPLRIGRLIADFLQKHAPEGTKVNVDIHPGVGKAIRSAPDSNLVQAFAQAYSEVFRRPCSFSLEGGSIPIATELAAVSGGELVLAGLGLAEDRAHAPNEHFSLERLEKGTLIIARAMELLGK